MIPLERRIVQRAIDVRTRRTGAGAAIAETTEVSGYGAVFNSETIIGSWFREKIMPGAFAPVIGKTADVRSLFNHDPNQVLGRTTAGTLRLVEDADGLRYELDVNRDDPAAVGIAARIARKDVTGSSFGFRVKREEWVEPDDGSTDLPLRVIHEFADLFDVGPVTFPAYDASTAEARDAARALISSETVPADVRARLERRFTEQRSVPKNVSTKKAPTDTPWSAPALKDFTDKGWDELAASDRTHIAGHFAWKDGDTFGDLHLPHHRSADGAVVLRGVVAAAGRLNQTAGVEKKPVQAHLEAHYHAFGLKAPWEDGASSAQQVDQAIQRQEADGEEAAELVQYQTLAALLAHAASSLTDAQALVRELIAAETDTPTDTDEDEAAEEAVECARFTSLLAMCDQVRGALCGIEGLAQTLLEEHDHDEDATPALMRSAEIEDADRLRRLRLAQVCV